MKDNNILSKVLEQAEMRSLKSRDSETYGEYYTSHDIERQEKIENALKAILGVAVLAIGISFGGSSDFTDEVRSIVVEDSTHEFKNYVNDLNDYELNKLFNETSETMESEDSRVVEKVVDEMEENYFEQKNGRGK